MTITRIRISEGMPIPLKPIMNSLIKYNGQNEYAQLVLTSLRPKTSRLKQIGDVLLG
jgi:hypothetical protein